MTDTPNADDTPEVAPVDDADATVADQVSDEHQSVLESTDDVADDEHDGDSDRDDDDSLDVDDDGAAAALSAPQFAPPTAPSSAPQPVVPSRPRAEAAVTAANAWAHKWGVPNDPYVRGLTNAVMQGENLTMWANTDPSMLLPEPVSNAGRTWRRLARLLVVLRNVAVFIPVALTWMAIHEATGAFADFADANAGKELNFLVFWQSGGPDGTYLGDFWRIGSVALLDAVIISFIVAATLIASSLESRAKATEQHAAATAERERTELALRIGSALQGNRNADPEAVSEALANGLNSLSAAARDVSEAAARMEAATSGVGALAPRMAELNGNVEVLAQRLSSDVARSVDSLVASVSTLGVAMGGDMQRFLTEVLAGLEEVTERLGKTSVTVEFGTKQLRDDLDAVHARLAQLVSR